MDNGQTLRLHGDWSLDLGLPADIVGLREAALEQHRLGGPSWFDRLAAVDAHVWSEHSYGEDWLIWRARRTAERLRALPIELSPGERIVGRPTMAAPGAQEIAEKARADEVLRLMPPFPGGDAGHFHPDYEKLFRVGIGGLRQEVQARGKACDSAAADKTIFYQACDLALEGFSDYCVRVADECGRAAEQAVTEGDRVSAVRDVATECDQMAIRSATAVCSATAGEEDISRRWKELEGICRRVATAPPATFHEATELMFLTIVAAWFGEDHGLTTPGRMDQTLRPFYEADIAAGRITREDAFELICCLFIQLNMILVAGSAESVIVGGRDREGRDVTNDLTYLCLAARQATQLVYPTVGLAWHEGTPPELTDLACRMIATGIGDPAFFNDEVIASGLRDMGVSQADSYNYMNSTCVEIKVVGASNIWVASPYFNCPQALLDVMESVHTETLAPPASFADLSQAVRERLKDAVGQAARVHDVAWWKRSESACFPLASCLIDDCLERGLDFDRGGARYNWVECSFVGLANLVDGLLAVKRLLFDSEELTLDEIWSILQNNWEGHESLRLRILNRIPKYGNDDGEIDPLVTEWAEFIQEMTASHTIAGSPYVPGFFSWIIHEGMGSQTGATPDGRFAGFPLAAAASAAQGREKNGPTAAVLSGTKWDHKRALGGLAQNLRFSRNALKTPEDICALKDLILVYLRRGGFEIQVNVVSADDLRDAQIHPERHADLLVRIAGYSDYFVHLNPNMQAEIIARTEHSLAVA